MIVAESLYEIEHVSKYSPLERRALLAIGETADRHAPETGGSVIAKLPFSSG
jgi:hypothetical protein